MHKLKISMFVSALTLIGGVMMLTYKQQSKYSDLLLENIEALSHCESVDGYENDGHCVRDKNYNYFCKEPGFLQSKNCKQGA